MSSFLILLAIVVVVGFLVVGVYNGLVGASQRHRLAGANRRR